MMNKPSNGFLMFSLIGAVFALCILGLSVYASSVPNKIEANGDTANINSREKKIIISEKGFSPQNIVISVGDQVTWENADLGAHQVVSSLSSTLDNLSQFNEKIEKGESVSFVFENPGVFRYFDKLNQQFTGEVTVK